MILIELPLLLQVHVPVGLRGILLSHVHEQQAPGFLFCVCVCGGGGGVRHILIRRLGLTPHSRVEPRAGQIATQRDDRTEWSASFSYNNVCSVLLLICLA